MAIRFGRAPHSENILYDVQIQIIINYANMTRHDERVMHRLDRPAHTHTPIHEEEHATQTNRKQFWNINCLCIYLFLAKDEQDDHGRC